MNFEKIFEFIENKSGYKTPLTYKLAKNIPLEKNEKRINGDLDLSESHFQLLSQIEYVSGNFIIEYSEVTEIKDLEFVGGALLCEASRIQKLPDNLKIGGALSLEECPITKLPDNLEVGYNLILSHSYIETIPNNLSIDGDLILVGTPMSDNFSRDRIRQMIQHRGGYITGRIYLDYDDL